MNEIVLYFEDLVTSVPSDSHTGSRQTPSRTVQADTRRTASKTTTTRTATQTTEHTASYQRVNRSV